MGWNDLSPKEQADWKKKNYDMGINVSQGTIDDMNSRKTPEGNFDYYKKNKPNAEQREGLNRFYGTDKVNAALDGGGSKKKSGGFPTNTGTTGINIIGPDHIGPDTKPKKKGPGGDGPGVTNTTPPGIIDKLPKPAPSPGPTPTPPGGPNKKDKNPNIPGPGNPQMPSDFNNMAPKKKGGGKKDDNDWDEKLFGALGGAAVGSLAGPLGMAAGGYIGSGGKMPHITMPRITPTEKGALIGGALGGVPGAVTGAAIGRYGAGIKHVGHEIGEAAGSAVHGAGRVVGAAGHALGAAGAAVAGGARAVGHEVGEAAGSAARGAGRVAHAGEDAAESVVHGIGAAGSAVAHAAANGAHIVGHEIGEVGHAIGSGVHNVVSGIGSALGGIFGGMAGGTNTIPRRVEPKVASSVSNPTPTGHPVSSQFTKPMAGMPYNSLPVSKPSTLPQRGTGDSQHQNRTSLPNK
jgi:hypothetical protein